MKNLFLTGFVIIVVMTACTESNEAKHEEQTVKKTTTVESKQKKIQVSKKELRSYAKQKYKVNFNKLDKKAKKRIIKDYLRVKKLSNRLLAKGMKNNADLKVAMKLLTISLWSEQMLQNISVSDEKLKKMHQKMKPEVADRYRLSNVFVKAKKKAEKIKKKLSGIKDITQRKKEFESYVASTSLDTKTKNKKGDLGWINSDKVNASLKAQLKSRKINDILVIKVKNRGWNVLMITDHKKRHAASFKEAKPYLEEKAKQAVLNRKIKALMK